MERLLFEWQITSPAGSRPVHEGLAALGSLVKAQKSVIDWHSCPKQAPAFLSCLNQSLWTENILLFVQGYKMSGTQTKPIVLDFNFCELRSDFPRVDFFYGAFLHYLLWHLRSGVSLFSVPSFGTDFEIWSNCAIWKKELSGRDVNEDPTVTLAELQRSCVQMVHTGYSTTLSFKDWRL